MTSSAWGALNAPSARLWAIIRHYLWDRELRWGRQGTSRLTLAVCATLAGLAWLAGHADVDAWSQTGRIRPIYNGAEVQAQALSQEMVGWIGVALAARVGFGWLIALLDVVLYRRLSGRPFDWEGMINLSVVNLVYRFSLLATVFVGLQDPLVAGYQALLAWVPTVAAVDGVWALVLAALLGDFVFYWSHRWSHKNRLLWNLGHVNHHRNQNLTQLTHAIDALFLNVPLGTVLVLLGLPVLGKLLAFDISQAGWLLIAAMLIDTWTDPSHSPTLYWLEARSRLLRAWRWLVVTPGVHYTHHSREDRHNLSDGCNFGARFTLWDRLFGTYCEPPRELPEVGLFSPTADYCRTPVRFLFKPCVRMFLELRQNPLRYWPRIILGPTSYDPPNPVHMEF